MFRIGIGFDSHSFRKGRKLIIGGVEIPFKFGLFGHSDADLLFHSIADALLGAIGERDIGFYFPNTDQKLKNISSQLILQEVFNKVKKKRYKIVNIDCCLILDEPKINPYIEKMKENLVSLLKIRKDLISIKVKTFEGFNLPKVASSFSVVLLEKKR